MDVFDNILANPDVDGTVVVVVADKPSEERVIVL